MSYKVFTGCSKESLDIARAVQDDLSNRDEPYEVTIWNQNVMRNGDYTIPRLIKELKEHNYAIWIFNKDDVTTSRGRRNHATRDNVIFEYGLSAGILGAENSFIFKAKGLRLPSDFSGLVCSVFDSQRCSINARAGISSCVNDFVYATSGRENMLSWDKYSEDIIALSDKLSQSPRRGGFNFDAIIGISRGGIVAADMLNRRFKSRVPLLCLWGDEYTNQPETSFETPLADINAHIFAALENERYKNLLIVDDITRKGETITGVAALFRKKFPNKRIKTAVLFVPDAHKKKVDYYARVVSNNKILMPYSVLD